MLEDLGSASKAIAQVRLSLSLSLSLSVSLSLSLSLSRSLSLCVCLYARVSFSLSLPLTPPLALSLKPHRRRIAHAVDSAESRGCTTAVLLLQRRVRQCARVKEQYLLAGFSRHAALLARGLQRLRQRANIDVQIIMDNTAVSGDVSYEGTSNSTSNSNSNSSERLGAVYICARGWQGQLHVRVYRYMHTVCLR
jgi:hypothetical protein